MCYGASQVESYYSAARLVDTILKGGRPADLRQPTRFEPAVNARTVRAATAEAMSPLKKSPDRGTHAGCPALWGAYYSEGGPMTRALRIAAVVAVLLSPVAVHAQTYRTYGSEAFFAVDWQ